MSGTAPKDAPEQDRDGGQAADGLAPEQPGFGSRGKARRRARFLRRARELAYRDLGGLVYNLHRFGQRNDALVLGKLATLGHIDTELRTIEIALRERRPVTVLREAGITACPRCAAIHGSEDRFCPNCGLPMARNVDLPVAGPPAAVVEPAGAPAQPRAHQPGPTQPPAYQPGATQPVAHEPGPTAPPGAASGAAGTNMQPPSPTPPSRSEAGEESTEILHPRAPGS